MDPLSLLERKDKWFLGGGKGAIYAPPFPRWLEKPGFWDESYFADIRLTRLFTVLFCDYEMHFVRLRGEVISWRPDRMIVEHRSGSHTVRETRLVTEDHEWVSVFELVAGEPLHAFVWALPELREPGQGTPWQSLTSCEVRPTSIAYEFATAWPSELEPDRTGVEAENLSGEGGMLPPLSVHLSIGANQPRLSHTVNLAQRHDDSPLWETSLLPQRLINGRLPGDFKLQVGPPPVEGLVHIVQQYELRVGEPLVVNCAASLKSEGSEGKVVGPEVVDVSQRAWEDYFASVPQFSSSDPYLTNAYWYRWYGLRLNTVDIEKLPVCRARAGKDATYSPYITEGIGFFRNFVTYSAQAHLREVAWMHFPRMALGILENLGKCQREDGSFPGHNYSCRPARDFYHADFATGARQLVALHPGSLANQVIDCFKSYHEYMMEKRSSVYLHLVFDQNETGQEYMSRYSFVSDKADQWSQFKVAGVDATIYMQELDEFLHKFDPQPRYIASDTTTWEDNAYERGLAMHHSMFDEEASFYSDALPNEAGDFDAEDRWHHPVKSKARPATGLYSLMYFNNPVDREVAVRWLLNPNEFWLPKGFPATALSDATFSADGEWKDKRLNCPWNGRSWPMVNSHLVDAIANVARYLHPPTPSSISGLSADSPNATSREMEEGEPGSEVIGGELEEGRLRAKAGEALMKVITLMFHDGDPTRPNCYEHYDPITGTPSLYRGYDDYMHSWIVDLILRHAVGVQPGHDAIDPFPLGVDWIECGDIPHPKGRMDVRIERDQVVKCEVRETKA